MKAVPKANGQEINVARQRQANNNSEMRTASKRRTEQDRIRTLARDLDKQQNMLRARRTHRARGNITRLDLELTLKNDEANP